MPPELGFGEVRPAEDLARWLLDVFVAEGGPLANPVYEHLRHAEIGCLWTDVPNGRQQRVILAQTEIMPPPAMAKWQKARAEWQLLSWFGVVPDFLITFSAGFALSADDASFCALAEHELHHCGQDRDEFGMPKFNRETGLPKFAIRGHDVEEFVGVVERYGTEATGTTQMVEAARRGPTVASASIAAACGTCQARRRA